MGKRFGNHFTGEDTQMANKVWKAAPHHESVGKCSQKPQWDPFTLVRIPEKHQVLPRTGSNQQPCALLMGTQNGAAARERAWPFLINTHILYDAAAPSQAFAQEKGTYSSRQAPRLRTGGSPHARTWWAGEHDPQERAPRTRDESKRACAKGTKPQKMMYYMIPHPECSRIEAGAEGKGGESFQGWRVMRVSNSSNYRIKYGDFDHM